MSKRLLNILLLVSVVVCAEGQVVDSLVLDTIEGKQVYRYEVQKSEGLYRISKRFGVTQEQIIKLNPILQTEGLKLGQTIYIPVIEQIDSTQYIVHTLQPKETLYGLSKRYGVKVQDIEKLNPQTTKRMEIGKSLLIKKKEVATVESVEVDVEAGKLTDANVDSSLKLQSEDVKAQAVADEQQVVQQAVVPAIDRSGASVSAHESLGTEGIVAHEIIGIDPIAAEPESSDATIVYSLPTPTELPLRLAFLLPLMTDAPKRDANMDRFIDFYEGALLAIYEASQRGQKFDIYTYDVEKSDVAVQQILSRGELQMVDAMIGPVYPAQVSYASLFAKQNKIPILIPFTQKVNGVEHTPQILQFNPTADMMAAAILQHFEEKKDSCRFILVDASNSDIPSSVKAVHSALAKSDFEVKKITLQDILNDSIAPALAEDKENILVFNSEKYSSVQTIMSSLLPQTSGKDVKILAHYAWEEENSPLPLVFASVFHDVDSSRIGHFETLYNHYFGRKLADTHPRYDLLGYDLTAALILKLQQCSSALTEDDTDNCYSVIANGIQSDTRFERVSEQGGRINSAIYIKYAAH